MPTPASDPTLGVALQYAALGLRVLPIKPGTKRPPMKEWVESATSDPGIITNWYSGMYADHGTGLAMGHQPNGQFVFALDADEHDVAHSGVETLADLQTEFGHLPDTWCSITGSGGLHLLFAAPAGVEIRNTVAGDALDVRGEGGQIVVFPSVHPGTGRRYEWEHGFAPWERPIAEAPAWLLDIVKVAPTPVSTGGSPPTLPVSVHDFQNPDSPAEWLRSWWNWPVELRKAQWTEHHAARNGDSFWTRPGKAVRDGESAVLHMPDGPLVVWSTDASLLGLHHIGRINADGSVSVSGFEFYAWTDHHGDMKAAARYLASKMPGSSSPADRRLSDPDSSDENPAERYVAQVLDWHAFWTNDHTGENWVASPLIPAGRLTVFYAPAKQGKSEVVLAVVVALATGRPILGQRNDRGPIDVVYLDYEMTRDDLYERLELLGYAESDDLSHLHYYLLPSLPPLDTAEGAQAMRLIAAYHQAQVVVIDTMGRAVEGDENSNDTYRAFARHTGLTLKADGVAVVRTDHAGKDKEKGQRGASAKNDDADVVFRVDRVEKGWRIGRTHTRIGWVPDTIVVDRAEVLDAQGQMIALRIELSPTTNTWPDGTGAYVKELQAAGITIDQTTTYEQLKAMAQAIDKKLSKRKSTMTAALSWWKTEQSPTTVTPTASSAASRLSADVQETPGESPAPECQAEPITASNGNVEGDPGEPDVDIPKPW